MRRPAAPGKDFACPEPLPFLEISRDVIALAHALLKGLALAAGRKLQQLTGRAVGLHDAPGLIHGDDAAGIGFHQRAHVLVLDRQLADAFAFAQLRSDGFRRLPHKPERMDVHHVGTTAQGNGAEHAAPIQRKNRRARIADLAGLRGVHPVAGQEHGDALLKRQADGACPDVTLRPTVTGDAAPPLEMLHEIGIPNDIQYIAL